MKLKNPMLVVTDIDKSVEFYKKVLELHVIMDFGANKTLTGGLALQTVESGLQAFLRSWNDTSAGCRTYGRAYEICKCLHEINFHLWRRWHGIKGFNKKPL